MTLRRSLATCLVLASLAACTPWTRVDQGSRTETRRDDFSLDLPVGWVKRTANGNGNDFFVTRDGPALNYIVVKRESHDRKLPGTKRSTRAGMLPHDGLRQQVQMLQTQLEERTRNGQSPAKGRRKGK